MVPSQVDGSSEFFFTLVAKTNGGGVRPDYLNLLKQHLARISINLNIQILEWPVFLNELLVSHDFDIMYIAIGPISDDPDMLHVFGEGPYNAFCYEQSLDWNDTLGQGMNQWYLEQGRLIMPPDSQERVEHYWAWEQYLMDEILPMVPGFCSSAYQATWSNLKGFDKNNGLITSWGKLSWDGLHAGQTSTLELVLPGGDYINLNPLSTTDAASSSIIGATVDSLIEFDNDRNSYPHLAREIEMINDTHVRIHLRNGIKWQTDPEGFFTNEYLDVDDVYFTYYSWKHLSPNGFMFDFIEDMKKVDQYTLDLYIDGEPSTPENDLFAPFLGYLGIGILPEHYLNQTQLPDGVTPDITHNSWLYYSRHCFGTGIFEFDDHIEGVETTLELFDDCWILDSNVDKTGMNFDERFGDFSGGLTKLKYREFPNQVTQYMEFLAGHIDYSGLTEDQEVDIHNNPDFNIWSIPANVFGFFGFNLAESRTIIGNREPCENDTTISKGLAIRKAIAYAMNRDEINEIVHKGSFTVWHYPMYPFMGVWLNPNIIRYDHNLDMAKYYLNLAGYDIGYTGMQTKHFTAEFSVINIFICASILFLTNKIRKLTRLLA